MTGYKRALHEFWSGFGVPAYLSGTVPSKARLPYITYEAPLAPALNALPLTAFVWLPPSADSNTQRTEYADSIAGAIPEGGTRLDVSTGIMVLDRNTAGFLQDWQDPEDPTITGVRCGYIVRFYF